MGITAPIWIWMVYNRIIHGPPHCIIHRPHAPFHIPSRSDLVSNCGKAIISHHHTSYTPYKNREPKIDRPSQWLYIDTNTTCDIDSFSPFTLAELPLYCQYMCGA
eukprot:GHVO01017003.1.p1 GENE.GHVO01017003.1~~GHVO01017003.1.p1  ORF type:complete len:105 (-),score=13.65 GHVO01017003.1:124-438(-)